MLKVLCYILCDLDPKEKIIGQKAGICDGVPSTSALVIIIIRPPDKSAYWKTTFFISHPKICCGYSKEPSQ